MAIKLLKTFEPDDQIYTKYRRLQLLKGKCNSNVGKIELLDKYQAFAEPKPCRA